MFQSPNAKRSFLGVFDSGEGGDSHGLVVGFEVYVEQGQARGVRVPRVEVQCLDPPCDGDAVRDVVLGEEALGYEHCRAAAVEGVGVGVVEGGVGAGEEEVEVRGRLAAARVLEAENWEDEPAPGRSGARGSAGP